jgi:diguanylate cyclase (GGDEF)-like protein
MIQQRDTKQNSDSSIFPTSEDDQDTNQIDLTPVARSMHRVEDKEKTPCLVVLRGTDVGKVIPISQKQPAIIGRGAECSAIMLDESISRQHVKICMDESGHITAEDMGSTNGLFVDGNRVVTKTTLKPESKLILGGHTVLKLMLQDQLEHVFQQELYDSSTRDALTGTYNRRFLTERMLGDLSFSRRHRDPYTILMFDLDHFKAVNDVHGHPSGDQVLISVSEIVAKMIRSEDILCRYGGEEFVVLAPKIDLEGAKILGERIREGVEKEPVPAIGSDEIIQITVSIGIATVEPEVTMECEEILSVADNNLYRAKTGGRNRVVASIIKS